MNASWPLAAGIQTPMRWGGYVILSRRNPSDGFRRVTNGRSLRNGRLPALLPICIPKYTMRTMKTILSTETFDAWFAELRDQQAAARIKMRIGRVELGDFGDCEPMGEGVSEMRIHYGPG